ncbi:MAG TPA: C4-type zinc ribbon domain-containing protein [Opitutaceae bacterium]|nr:C4-type zinc ribbon domain-containing protein [Opitutaceae bacterium]
MPLISLEKLLILQDRDTRRAGVEAQLTSVPREVALAEQKIAAEKTAIEAARTELMEFESKKKLLETEIASAEQKVAKYRGQQLEVRKNDEYRALGTEIDTTQAAIGGLEEDELKVMFAIDEAKKKFAAGEVERKQAITVHETRIRTLREREGNLRIELKAAEDEVATARLPVAEPLVRVYERLVREGLARPVCVPIRDGKCSGCHMKVSGQVESAARKGDEITKCESCRRMVYWE